MLLEFFIACNIRYVFLSFDSIKTIIIIIIKVSWSSLLLAFFHMRILSVILVSALRYVSLLSIFVSSIGLLFSVQFSIKFYFLVYVNQSLSCIRRCRTDLVSIVFPVFFARFLSHLLYFKFRTRSHLMTLTQFVSHTK